MALRYQRMRMLAYISLFPRLVSARSRFILILQKRFIPTIILLMVVVLYHKPWPRYDTSLCKPRADQYSRLPCVAARTLRAGGGTRNALLQRRSRSAISRHSFSAGLDVASGIKCKYNCAQTSRLYLASEIRTHPPRSARHCDPLQLRIFAPRNVRSLQSWKDFYSPHLMM